MLELVLFCDFLIRFDAESSSTHTDMKTHTCVSSDSCSLIKSLAFEIIQNWLQNKGRAHRMKEKKQVRCSVDVHMGPRHTACLLLVIEFGASSDVYCDCAFSRLLMLQLYRIYYETLKGGRVCCRGKAS